MALIIREVLNFHDYALEQWKDPRVDDWFLMGSFWHVAGIILVYLYFVLSLGPKLMQDRKPFNLDKILIAYNALQVVYCMVLILTASMYILPYYSLTCEPCDYSLSERGILAAKLTWWYFILKIIDLLDTVFFVLRKKNGQISFLHVYHHAGMIAVGWIGTRFIPGGSIGYLGVVNVLVHIPMYGYYLYSVLYKSYTNRIWWKKQITHLQLAQFGVITLLYTQLLLFGKCAFPKWICMFLIPQNLFMFCLFGDFYIKAYIRAPRQIPTDEKKAK